MGRGRGREEEEIGQFWREKQPLSLHLHLVGGLFSGKIPADGELTEMPSNEFKLTGKDVN